MVCIPLYRLASCGRNDSRGLGDLEEATSGCGDIGLGVGYLTGSDAGVVTCGAFVALVFSYWNISECNVFRLIPLSLRMKRWERNHPHLLLSLV